MWGYGHVITFLAYYLISVPFTDQVVYRGEFEKDTRLYEWYAFLITLCELQELNYLQFQFGLNCQCINAMHVTILWFNYMSR